MNILSDETSRALEKLKLDAERYRKVRLFLTNAGYFSHNAECVVKRTYIGPAFYGPTFDAAVDALPDPEEK